MHQQLEPEDLSAMSDESLYPCFIGVCAIVHFEDLDSADGTVEKILSVMTTPAVVRRTAAHLAAERVSVSEFLPTAGDFLGENIPDAAQRLDAFYGDLVAAEHLAAVEAAAAPKG